MGNQIGPRSVACWGYTAGAGGRAGCIYGQYQEAFAAGATKVFPFGAATSKSSLSVYASTTTTTTTTSGLKSDDFKPVVALQTGGQTTPAVHDDSPLNGVQFLTFYANGNAESASPSDPAKMEAVHANIFATANLSAIEAAWNEHGLAGMLTVDSVWLWHTNPAINKKEGGLRPGWRAHLQTMLSSAMPLIKKGSIRAVFLGDEVCYVQAVPGSNVSTVATIIRKFLRTTAAGINTLVYLNECTRALHPATGRGYLGNPLPADIDAISLDGYCPSKPNGCSSAEQEGKDLMKNIYNHQLFPKMLPHQRVFVVPGLFATANASVPIKAQDEQLVLKWKGYLDWIATEPRIIGINPWHFDSWAGGDGLGASSFPKTLAAVAAFGKTLPPLKPPPFKADDSAAARNVNSSSTRTLEDTFSADAK